MMFPLASLNMLGISAAEDDAEGSAAAEDSFGGEAIPAPTLHKPGLKFVASRGP